MPNEKAAEPLSEEKLSDNDLERIEREGFTFADVRALLAKVRLGRHLPRGLRFVPDEQGGHMVDDGGLIWRPVSRPR